MQRMSPVKYRDPLLDIPTLVKNMRASFAIGTLVPKPSKCHISNETLEHEGHLVHAYWINHSTRKFQGKSDKLVLYFHDGGYFLGGINSKLLHVLRQREMRFFRFDRLQWSRMPPSFTWSIAVVLKILYPQPLMTALQSIVYSFRMVFRRRRWWSDSLNPSGSSGS